jgi:pimeloyl-ACP methyl ester carboxylesterase
VSTRQEGTAELADVALQYSLRGAGTQTLVLTHGLGGSSAYWDGVVEPLARHYRVLRWDLRGAGSSSRPPGPYSPALFAQDLTGLLDHLAIDRAHLVGHSGGGVVSQRFALDFPHRVRSLVLVSTSSEVGEKASAAWLRLADMIEARGFGPNSAPDVRGFAPAFAAARPDVVETLTRATRANDPRAYAESARAFGTYRWTAELDRVDVPALILQGLDDIMTPPGGSVIMSRHLRRSRLVMIPGAGHNLPLEQPVVVATAIVSFLAGIDC